jgi:hypothetical protein
MSSVVVRKIGSVPALTSSGTWRTIVRLIAEPGGRAESELLSVTGLAAMMIADENSSTVPIVVTPETGSRVRIYTVHGDDADDAAANETPLATWPTSGAGWAVSLPCQALDLEMARTAVVGAAHVTVRDLALGLALDEAEASAAAVSSSATENLRIDTTWLSR